MRTHRVLAVIVVLAVTLVGGGLDASQSKKKAKSSRAAAAAGAAGAVAGPRALINRPLVIDGDDAQGFYCALSMPNVHYLGTLPPNTGVKIDFESTDNSDPIAVLTTVKLEGTSVGAENVASDDDGGQLNPRFELRRSYWATYILTVSSADDDEACYAYRMRWVQ
ncbi:MAG: hypothetical protein A3J29_07560 [Acidobacteria bacterium RIFCSPLOWO2_12_FULL_67_14b]|nr:MAG: hypothetical protein A3J29_07560 [Acidobacteria bacterium RIFCSPLOWO2_12_FULL_67_14b]